MIRASESGWSWRPRRAEGEAGQRELSGQNSVPGTRSPPRTTRPCSLRSPVSQILPVWLRPFGSGLCEKPGSDPALGTCTQPAPGQALGQGLTLCPQITAAQRSGLQLSSHRRKLKFRTRPEPTVSGGPWVSNPGERTGTLTTRLTLHTHHMMHTHRACVCTRTQKCRLRGGDAWVRVLCPRPPAPSRLPCGGVGPCRAGPACCLGHTCLRTSTYNPVGVGPHQTQPGNRLQNEESSCSSLRGP